MLNLASKLTDGQKIYIPDKSQNANVKGQNFGSGGTIGTQTNGLLNINTASQGELEKLPGIGPVTAQKIITNRPYTDVQELLSRKVVGAKVFDQIKGSVSVY